MKNRPAIYVLICALSFAQPAPANEFGNMFGLMFRMMLGMMGAMSDVMSDNSNDFGWGGGNSFGLGMTALPMMSGMSGMNPWSSYGAMPFNSMGMTPWNLPMAGTPWNNSFPGGYNPSMFPGYANNYYNQPNYRYPARYGATVPPARYASSSLLNGRWYGDSGEILEVRGNQFRLQDAQSAISGAVRVKNNIVNLFARQTGGVTQYTFARNQSELILQDASGRVLVFRQRPVNRAMRVF
ncbi:MAG: hypothetical protein KAJ06_11435 [Gammaproteobacteria bacterium]|nr:hypothetical protein [Gammaproteobacteria bacterium]